HTSATKHTPSLHDALPISAGEHDHEDEEEERRDADDDEVRIEEALHPEDETDEVGDHVARIENAPISVETVARLEDRRSLLVAGDRKSTRLNSSHVKNSYA